MLVAAIGCFLFALLAEPFLYFLQRPVESKNEPQLICLTIDTSGSMYGDNLAEVKKAAKSFIEKRDLSRDKIALVTFNSWGEIRLPLTQNQGELFSKIDELFSDGGTNFEAAMTRSEEVVSHEEGNLAVLLFTDGENSEGDPRRAVRIASQLRERNIGVFAIATPDADFRYLTSLTGSHDRVVSTRSGDFGNAFAKAEAMISTKTLAGTHQGGFTSALIFIMLLAVFFSCGITFSLVGTQNKLLKKPLFTTKQFLFLLAAAILAGTVSGFIAEIFNTGLRIIYLGAVGSFIGWTVLGVILAFGMGFFIPNLDRKVAMKGGTLGGLLGALGFIIFGAILGDIAGRLLGAFILGGCIGAMVGIVEVVSRKVWLAVVHSPRDVTLVNLGPQLVTVGSGNDDTVLVRDAVPSAAEFRVEGNAVRYKGPDGKRTLEPGARVKLGNVELVICSQDVPFSPSRFYPMKFSKAQELKARGKMPPQA